MNVTEILQRLGHQYPDAIAIIDRFGQRDRRTSYAKLNRSINTMASRLRASELRPGDTVLIFQPMSAELYFALAAVLRAGMRAMFIDPSAGRQHIDRCCDLIPPRGLIASKKAHLLRLMSPSLRRIPIKYSIGGIVPWTRRLDAWGKGSDDGEVHPSLAEEPALVSFTSGTTGQPKAVVRTHGFLLSQHRAVERHFNLVAGEIELVTMPIFVLANLASRVTSVIADTDLRRVAEVIPGPILRQIRQSSVDRITASPAFFRRIAEYCQRTDTQLPSLQKIFTGGGPVPPRVLAELQQIAPNAKITAVYGSTEAEPISTLSMKELSPQDLSAIRSGQGLLLGRPVDSLEVKVIRDQSGKSLDKLSQETFDDSCLDPGTPGEIVVSGNHVLDGYVCGQSNDTNKFQVGSTRWHRTGDAGYFDASGRLWLLGRCAARVDDDRGRLYPLGVEQAAMQDPCIDQAALVSHRGQRVLAISLCNPKIRPNVHRLLKTLAFASVDSICIIKRMPVDRRHQSKIDYPLLHQQLEE